MVVLQQMGAFFILMAIGWIAHRANILSREMLPKLSSLIVNICGPCLIVSGALSADDRMSGPEVLTAFAVLAVLTACMAAVALIVPRLLRYPSHLTGLVNFGFWMTNIGYLGMPLVAGVWGSRAMIYVTFYLIINNAMLYTYGIFLASKGATGRASFSPRKLINTGNAATIVTILVYFLGIPVAEVVASPIMMLGNATAPLAMMLVGAQLAGLKVPELLGDWRLGVFVVLKMIAFPIAILLLLKPFVADPLLLGACLAVVATPTGVLVGAFTQLYNPRLAVEASKLVSATTLVAVATIPLVSLACGI